MEKFWFCLFPNFNSDKYCFLGQNILPDVIYLDNHLLVLNKPAGIATMGAESGKATLVDWAKDYLKQRFQKPGNVYLGVVSRLDTVTSGVIVLARTSKSAARLTSQFADHEQGATKVYLAVLQGHLDAEEGELCSFIRKDDAAHRMRIASQPGIDALEARLKYVVLDRTLNHSLVAIRLRTGRKHQIRVQFLSLGHPIVGDRKYGSNESFHADEALGPAIALHSWRLAVEHPTMHTRMNFGVEPPRSWKAWTSGLALESSLVTRVGERLELPRLEPLVSNK